MATLLPPTQRSKQNNITTQSTRAKENEDDNFLKPPVKQQKFKAQARFQRDSQKDGKRHGYDDSPSSPKSQDKRNQYKDLTVQNQQTFDTI